MSFSGQAVVFVVRTAKHSMTVVAGKLTYIAYFLAQVFTPLRPAPCCNPSDPTPERPSCMQVSFSGQAVVFVVRTAKHSFAVVAGSLTYIAYFAAQVPPCLMRASYACPSPGLPGPISASSLRD